MKRPVTAVRGEKCERNHKHMFKLTLECGTLVH